MKWKYYIQKVIFSLENDTYFWSEKVVVIKLWNLQVCNNFSRKQTQNSHKSQTYLETKIKILERNITDKDKFNEHKITKDELVNLYNNIATGVKIRRKCDWYQYGQKSIKYFLNLEKQKPVTGIFKK